MGSAGAVAVTLAQAPSVAQAAAASTGKSILPAPSGRNILLSCKLGMIAKKAGDRDLTLVERLKMAGEAGFDGVDFDEAGRFTVDEARNAVQRAFGIMLEAGTPLLVNARLNRPGSEPVVWLMLRGTLDSSGHAHGSVQNIIQPKIPRFVTRASGCA